MASPLGLRRPPPLRRTSASESELLADLCEASPSSAAAYRSALCLVGDASRLTRAASALSGAALAFADARASLSHSMVELSSRDTSATSSPRFPDWMRELDAGDALNDVKAAEARDNEV